MSSSNLFVYGTLRRGSDNEFSRLLSDNAEFLGPARMQGKLFQIGEHTGAVRSAESGDTVRGEIFRLADPSGMLSTLDEYEGSEFERALMPVDLDSGEQVEAWVYLYKGRDG